MKKVKLPSGAELEISKVPFAEGEELCMALSEEMKGISFNAEVPEDINFFKDSMLGSISSPRIRDAIRVCMGRCLYNGERITDATWESASAREDYYFVYTAVAAEVTLPFGRGLFAGLSQLRELLVKFRA